MHERAAGADVYNSPGWKRMQARTGQHRAPVNRTPLIIDAKPAVRFTVGDLVKHDRFGQGTVMGISEDTLTVQFEGGFKNVKAAYIRAADEDDDVPF